jgi:hypothetical protein
MKRLASFLVLPVGGRSAKAGFWLRLVGGVAGPVTRGRITKMLQRERISVKINFPNVGFGISEYR